MIDFKTAKIAFLDYLKNYDIKHGKIELKIRHTYGVVKASEYIAKKLLLNDENIELAKLIALLHDIGRFEQIKRCDSFIDINSSDHAKIGVEILFDKNTIRNFIKEDKYDNIIYKAISNHNKLKIEDGLKKEELLHSKLIRDADKTDNFRVKSQEDFENIIDNGSRGALENDIISDKIFNDFMENKIIISKDRKTYMDFWVSYIAFIFDFNYIPGLEYISDNGYIDKIIDRLDYKNFDTIYKMEKIKEHANNYVNERIKNGRAF